MRLLARCAVQIERWHSTVRTTVLGHCWPSRRDGALALILGLGYFSQALLGLYLARQPGAVAMLWYADALAVLVLMRRPWLQWWLWLGGIGLADAAARALLGAGDAAIEVAVGSDLIGIALAAWLLQRRPRLHHEALRDPVALCGVLLFGAVVPALAGAAFGLGWQWHAGSGGHANYWLADLIGSISGSTALLPLGLWLAQHGRQGLADLLRPEVLAQWLVLLALGLLVPLWLPYPLIYLGLLLVALALVRGFGEASLGVLLMSFVVGVLVANGLFLPPPMVQRWQALLFYLPQFMTLLPPLLLAAAVDARRSYVRQLRLSEERYRVLYRRTPAMMHSMDADGRLLSVSDLWLRKLGYREYEVVGRRMVDFLAPESRRQALQWLLPEIDQHGRVDGVPCQWLSQDGRALDGMLSAIVEHGADGQTARTLVVIEDVTERNRLAAELASSELFEVTLESIGDGVITTDAQGRIKLVNPVAEGLLGATRAEIYGQRFDDVVHLHDESSGERLEDPVRCCLETGERIRLREGAQLRSRSGRHYPVQDSVAPIRSRAGHLLGAVMVLQDVSESRALSARMSHLAQHDALTDLPNRVLLEDRIAQCCQRGLRDDVRFAVMMLDLDHFKRVNDTHGHACGDEVLRVVARRLVATLRASDTVCRLGGDEFVILLSELPVGDEAADVAEKILRDLKCPIELESGATQTLSASLGIATYPEDGGDAETLIRHADTAMYRAKREGGHLYRFFTRAMDEAAVQRLALEQDLRLALEQGEFALHYQPIIDVRLGCVVAAEALVRWQRQGRLMSPGRFLPTAEEARLMPSLGRWILRSACEQWLQWQEGGQMSRIGRVSVNVSPSELLDPQFVPHLAALMIETQLPPGVLELELSEATLMIPGISAVLHEARAQGVRIALDDFGAGQSSLAQLKRMPIDTLKLDPLFVHELPDSAPDREIVRAVLAIGQNLGLSVVVEGVETSEQLRLLRDLGATEMQGHLLARPAPVSMWPRLVNSIVIPS